MLYVRHIATILLVVLAGCGQRPTKPLVLTEQVGELPVQFSSPDCQIPVLSAPPEQPYEVIAQVKSYGNAGTDIAKMRTLVYRESCALGAHAMIIQPLKEGAFTDEVSATHLGYSSTRDYTSTAEYAFQIVALAIRYKAATIP